MERSSVKTADVAPIPTPGVSMPMQIKIPGLISDPWRPRKIGQRQEGRIDLLYQFAILFGLGFHGLPFRIVLEGLPVCGCRLAARMLENVKEGAAFHGLVERCPVSNALDS